MEKVKRSQSGMIVESINLPPDVPLSRAEEITSTCHISGVPITNAGLIESHSHDVIITREALKYQISQH